MHLDSTFRGWSATLATMVRLVIARLVLIFALPLDFHGGSGLHGPCLSLVLCTVLRLLFLLRLVYGSCGLLLSGLCGPVVSLLPILVRCLVCWIIRLGVILRFALYGSGSVCFVGSLLTGRMRFPGFFWLLEHVADGCPGHGPVHLLVDSAAEIGFVWSPEMVGWAREGLPVLSNLAGPIQHFRAAILEGWRGKVSADLCARKGFRGFPWPDVDGSLQLLNSDHVRERDKALLRSILLGGVWNGFVLGKVKGQHVPCRFCGGADGGGHLFWDYFSSSG